MPEAVRKNKIKLGKNDTTVIVRKFLYDFSVLGGAAGTVNLKGADGSDAIIPPNTIITRCWNKTLTALTSGGAATVALGVTGAGTALQAATAFSDSSYNAVNATGFKNPSAPVVVTTDVNLTATIATAALTAGKVEFYVEMQLV